MKLPNKINVMGNNYKITYTNRVTDTDPEERRSLYGFIDHWKREIRIYAKDRTEFDKFQNLLHEVIHAISNEIHIDLDETETDLLATMILDTFTRNGFLK